MVLSVFVEICRFFGAQNRLKSLYNATYPNHEGRKIMAFAIELKISDMHLAKLLKHKLSSVFSDAYVIVNGTGNYDELIKLAEYSITLYDNRFTLPDDPMSLPIFSVTDNGVKYISISSLTEMIRESITKVDYKDTEQGIKGRSHILFPFSYIEDREQMIKEYFEELRYEADHVIRIDLMSGLRMPAPIKTGPEAGSLTALLRAASSDRFKPEDILQYCNPDLSGFLTPGRPLDPDDVFDADPGSILSLLEGLSSLSKAGNDPDIITLAVIEGFRLSTIKKLIPLADTIHILLPSRKTESASGIGNISDIFKRELTAHQKLIMHYCEDYKKGTHYERTGI